MIELIALCIFCAAVLLTALLAGFMVWTGRWVIALDHENCLACRDLPALLREQAE